MGLAIVGGVIAVVTILVQAAVQVGRRQTRQRRALVADVELYEKLAGPHLARAQSYLALKILDDARTYFMDNGPPHSGPKVKPQQSSSDEPEPDRDPVTVMRARRRQLALVQGVTAVAAALTVAAAIAGLTSVSFSSIGQELPSWATELIPVGLIGGSVGVALAIGAISQRLQEDRGDDDSTTILREAYENVVKTRLQSEPETQPGDTEPTHTAGTATPTDPPASGHGHQHG